MTWLYTNFQKHLQRLDLSLLKYAQKNVKVITPKEELQK